MSNVVKTHKAHAHEHNDHDDHGGSLKLYWGIALVLLIATLIEVGLSYALQEIWPVSGGVLGGTMMGIALVKAMLVIMYYMHLKYEPKILWVIFAIPFILVTLLIIVLFSQP